MRLIVVGQLVTSQGIQQVNVWFRFPVPTARQPYYANLQSGYQPQAPGDYSVADQPELAQFRNGLYVERPFFADVIDPTSSLATIQARLVNIYNAASTAATNLDNNQLSRWGSAYDGTAWNMKSS